ncbi:putative lipoprotein YbaY/putative membrane protein [Pseudoxanthomonas japonensis]|uniref:YbaY family lipoprotein n=1 Tax=Pseudoxanthomonas japonensis TaxID=69284 RepID=UPI0028658971|nr:YbaY family lipoprotein [Pseudoxanthomonas japonensis]MDR7070184.1 putative lipoprotein YbaY/putative membrane protein [Pseudoxanthomonas japonensis]
MFRPLLIAACLLALAACQSPATAPTPGGASVAPHPATTIQGRALYLERIAPPLGAVLSVQLIDNQLADTPAAVIASADFADIKGPPFVFSLPYDAAKLRPNGRYGLHAGLRDAQGTLWFVTDTRVPVTPGSSAPVEFRLVRAGGDPVAPVAGTPWEQAKARGSVFRGLGTEPGWSVEVGGGTAPRLSADLDYGERRIEVARANKTSDGYVGSTGDGLAVSLTTKKESCSDGMSDTEYPASAILTVAGKTYRGCGRFLSE